MIAKKLDVLNASRRLISESRGSHSSKPQTTCNTNPDHFIFGNVTKSEKSEHFSLSLF